MFSTHCKKIQSFPIWWAATTACAFLMSSLLGIGVRSDFYRHFSAKACNPDTVIRFWVKFCYCWLQLVWKCRPLQTFTQNLNWVVSLDNFLCLMYSWAPLLKERSLAKYSLRSWTYWIQTWKNTSLRNLIHQEGEDWNLKRKISFLSEFPGWVKLPLNRINMRA